jgi:TPR repeat protein
MSGNASKCPFCNSDRGNKTDEDGAKDNTMRAKANDPASICLLAAHCHHGLNSVQQDHAKAIELYGRAAELGCSGAHGSLGDIYDEGGNLKKAKFHWEAAAMAGDEVARCNLGVFEAQSGNIEQAIKHWTIAASVGSFNAMQRLKICFGNGHASKESMDSTLTAYNNSCAEMRSEARDKCICAKLERI